MWIAILGASSTGKEVIADILRRRDYSPIVATDRSVQSEMDYFIMRLSEQMKAQSVMFEKDVYTSRCIWDSFNVMTKVALEMSKIGQAEYDQVERSFNQMTVNSDVLQPPNLVIFTRMEKRDIQNRTLLQGRQPDDKEISRQIELYEEFISSVKVPKIELDMSNNPALINEELNFGIDSVKSMYLTQKTIWRRNMFY